MTKKQAIIIYLVLIVAIVPLAAGISWYRAGMGPFDPVLTLGISAFTFVKIMMTLGAAVGFNIVLGYLFRRPLRVLAWIPVATLIAIVAHHLAAPYYGLLGLDEMGVLDAYLMYLPSVALFSLLGGLFATLMFRRFVSEPIEAA
jgi:hypothetical protein